MLLVTEAAVEKVRENEQFDIISSVPKQLAPSLKKEEVLAPVLPNDPKFKMEKLNMYLVNITDGGKKLSKSLLY